MMKTTERVRRMLDSPLWTNLRRFQRDVILDLCNLCDSCENAADTFGKELMLKKPTAEYDKAEIERLKAEAVKEFAERLKKDKIKPEFPWDDFTVTEGMIDELVKEFTEGGE